MHFPIEGPLYGSKEDTEVTHIPIIRRHFPTQVPQKPYYCAQAKLNPTKPKQERSDDSSCDFINHPWRLLCAKPTWGEPAIGGDPPEGGGNRKLEWKPTHQSMFDVLERLDGD